MTGRKWSRLPAFAITIELFNRGYNENEVEKIWGGNFLRVFKEVQKTD